MKAPIARIERLAFGYPGGELPALSDVSLERALTLAESMEARGYGRPARARPARSPFSWHERTALAFSLLLVVSSLIWL